MERHDTRTCNVCNRGDNNILQASQKYKQRVKNVLEQHIKKKKGAVTFSIECQIKLVKYNCEGDEEFKEVFFNTKKLLSIDGFNELYDEAMENMNEKLDKYMSEQPEWVMDKISTIILNIANSENMCSGSIWVYTCVQCEEDRQSEGGDDKSETSDESGEDEWLEDNVEVKNRYDQSDITN